MRKDRCLICGSLVTLLLLVLGASACVLAPKEAEEVQAPPQPEEAIPPAPESVTPEHLPTVPPSVTTISGELEEGSEAIYTINDKNYLVEALSVSSEGSATFRVNNEVTNELIEGETEVLSDRTEIGVTEIYYQSFAGGIMKASFFLGADKLSLKDPDTTDTKWGNELEVNGETIEDSQLIIRGSPLATGDEFEITSIKYRLLAGSDIYIPSGTGLREQLDEPEGMLTSSWDIRYEGLMDTGVTTIRFDAVKDDEGITLEFTNQEGIFYDIPLMSNGNPAVGFVYGDDDDDLWFTESNNFVIGEGDYFILSNCLIDSPNVLPPAGFSNNICSTQVLRFDSVDPANRQLTFTDLGTGTREVATYDSITRQGKLVMDGVTHLIEVNDGDEEPSWDLPSGAYSLAIDLNGDGKIIDGDKILIAVEGGGLIVFNTPQCLVSPQDSPREVRPCQHTDDAGYL